LCRRQRFVWQHIMLHLLMMMLKVVAVLLLLLLLLLLEMKARSHLSSLAPRLWRWRSDVRRAWRLRRRRHGCGRGIPPLCRGDLLA
jgi:hypothetical protein